MKLNEISKEEELEIACSCVSFFLGYKKINKYRTQHKHILELVGSKYITEVWTIITCGTSAMSKGSVLSKFPFKRDTYTKQNKTYGFKLSCDKTKQVVDRLVTLGFLQKITGYHNPRDKTKSKTSVLRFLPKFTILFDGIDVSKYSSKSLYSYVEVRSGSDKEHLLSTRGLVGVALLKEEVSSLNKVLGSCEISVTGYKCVVEYTRIFIDNLRSSGRFYCGSFQTLPSKYREYITIDGEVTVEIDISSIHPAILACLNGIKLPDNHRPYEADTGVQGDYKEKRKLCKQALLCVLYSKSRKSAIASVIDTVKKDKEKYKSLVFQKGDYSRLIDSIIAHNYMIADHFFSCELWKTLQHLDSEICRYIICEFTELGKPILAYHDSWRVALSDQGLLEKLIPEAWCHVLGTKDNLKFEIK